jgi:polar amino acid transport system substrate-binding protein
MLALLLDGGGSSGRVRPVARLPLSLIVVLLAAGGTARADAGRPLKVGIAGTAPFVVHDSSAPRGFSVDVWKAVAARAGLECELVAIDSVSDAVAGVAAGELDVAVGPISITAERARKVGFTQPYFQSALGILARAKGPGTFERLRPFLTRAFLYGISGLFCVLGVVGALIWISERKENTRQFSPNPVQGIGAGIWLALITMTTVGFGDKAPVTLRGRLITGAWALMAMLTASSLTAGIATALTLSQLDRPAIASADELSRRRVSVVEGTTSVDFAARRNARVEAAPTIEAAVSSLVSGNSEAVVFDRPMLLYHLSRNPSLELVLSEASYDAQGYGFAVARGSSLQGKLDVALLELAEGGRLTSIRQSWLGN